VFDLAAVKLSLKYSDYFDLSQQLREIRSNPKYDQLIRTTGFEFVNSAGKTRFRDPKFLEAFGFTDSTISAFRNSTTISVGQVLAELEDLLLELAKSKSPGDLPGRLAATLLGLIEKEGQTIAFTQQELSEMLGMTRESIIKQLQAWAARSWVRLEHGAIVVLDANALLGLTESGFRPTTIRQIVPDQKIAPIQFEISNNKIIVSPRKSPSREGDATNIKAAKAELQRNGDKIISELQQSNCDRRLLASVQELQVQFQGEIDAIKVGLMNIGCEMMCNSYEAELPIAVASMLRAHTRGVQMFVGQFPEWAKFVENAATADLDQADITSLKAASQTIVERMKMQPELVDPEVPHIVAYLAEMLSSPTKAGKRAAFAVLRSLENLVSRVFGYGADFLEKTAEKSIDRASTAASKVVVRLLALGLIGAVAIGPVSSKSPT
jgi:hypothetical protein